MAWVSLGVLLLAFYVVLLMVFVGLPLGLAGYIIYKVIQHRRELSEIK